jgi:hypothetical protein
MQNTFKAAPIYIPPPSVHREIPVRPLTEPETPQLRTRVRGEMSKAVHSEKTKDVRFLSILVLCWIFSFFIGRKSESNKTESEICEWPKRTSP